MLTNEVFMHGNSLQVCNLIRLNLRNVDHDFTWHMRGISLMRIVIDILVYQRDVNNQPFDYDLFKQKIEYKELVKYLNERIPDKYKEELGIYFSLLPEQYEDCHLYIIRRFRCISTIAMHPIEKLSVESLFLNRI
ncbi:hypothetical protein RRR87_003250 [Salmonella enterica]|nr:hypothetical protein [Salmonella enterica]